MRALPEPVRDALLKAGELYEVGGSVRDRLLGIENYDLDYLVTGIPMPELVQLLTPHGRADWVGRAFGVVKFTFWPERDQSVTVDIALPRRETSTGSGHRDFEVDFDPGLPVEDDLGRRDFTVNAMAVRLRDGKLIDPYDGQADTRAKTLRMIFPEAFREDPLRMLRGICLSARLGFELDEATRKRLDADVALISEVSPERIADEINKLFALAAKPSQALALMEATGMLDVLLPELRPMVGCDQPGPYHAFDVWEHSCKVVDAMPADPALRWAALLHDVEKPSTKRVSDDKVTFYDHENLGAKTARKILSRLKYGNDLMDDVAVLIERHLFNTDMGDKGLRRLIRHVGIERLPGLLALRRGDVLGQGMGASTADVDEFEVRIQEEIERKPPFTRSDLAVDGTLLMQELGIPAGPKLGRVLDYLMERVLDDPNENNRDTLLKWAREFLQSGSAMAAALLVTTVALWGR